MLRRIGEIAAVVALSANVAYASSIGNRTDLEVFDAVSTAVTDYTRFTIFDDVNASVKDGAVTLSGRVTDGFKRAEIVKRVSRVEGVRQLRDTISVLPVSPSDDRLRYRVARAIYGDPNFMNYPSVPTPPIHIIVERGHVTLTGVVASEFDRTVAEMRARRFLAFSVTNNLRTDAEVRSGLERM
jgi:hyperosmotically inducible protein